MSKHNKNRPAGSSATPAQAHVAKGDPGQQFQQAVEYYGRQDWKSAEKLCRQALQVLPQHFDALHLLGSLLLQSQRFEEAEAVLQRALAVQPGSPQILTKLGIVCTHLKHFEAAQRHLELAISTDPRHLEAYASRGALHEAMGNPAAAIGDHQRALELRPDFVLGYLLLGNCLALTGRHDEAIDAYDRALERAPGFLDAYHARGNAYRESSRLDEAAQSYEAALRLDPHHFPSLSSLADLLIDSGRAVEALPYLHKVIALQPDNQDALLERARLHYARSELELAYKDFARLVQINPHHAKAFEGIGNVHHRLNRLPTALANYDQALALDPQRGSAHLGRSAALRSMTQLEKAMEAAESARQLSPEQAEVYSNLANIHVDMRQLDLATLNFRRACELNPNFANARSSLLFTLNFQAEVSPADVLQESREWERHHAMPWYGQQYPHVIKPLMGRKLRVGYVSPDIRQHAVGAFVEPILAHHDRDAVELFCYYCHPGRDDTTERLAPLFDHWVEAVTLSDDELAGHIHRDGIDVLVDLAGHTSGNRLEVFARKPAPVQITYLGYPGTTGMTAMDYRITDAQADPDWAEAYYVEKLLRLPHSLWCYQTVRHMPDVGPLPALNRGHLTLGSFNNFNKLDQRSITLWARILREVPGTRLVVATVPHGPARDAMIAAFAAESVEASRIDILPWMSKHEFWTALERVDVALDPVTVNGATTTCESLWMGVPTLSRVGARFLERAGLSILTTAGLSEFACTSDDDCVRLIQRLAADLPALSALRTGLRDRLARTPLFDGAAFTRSIEALYRQAWDRWEQSGSATNLEGLPSESIQQAHGQGG